jgi:sugar lactone lactonase YvrE
VNDIPNNRIMKFSEKDGSFSVFRQPATWANGNTRDRQGRLITCEHSLTRRISRIGKDGKNMVLADSFEGKKLDAPNDVVVSDDSVWFTDPLFGTNGESEGSRAKPEQATTNVYRIAADGKLWCGWRSHGARQNASTEVGMRKVFQFKGKSDNWAYGAARQRRQRLPQRSSARRSQAPARPLRRPT